MLEVLFSGSITTTCLVGLVTALVVYWLIQKWKYNYPPGPMGLPLIGNLLQIDAKTLHEDAVKMSDKYKSPVVTVQLGTMTVVIVNKLDPVMEVLVKKSTDFAARMLTPSLELFTYGGKDIALSSYGPTWKILRRIASTALRHYMKGSALETRVHDAVHSTFVEIDQQTGEFDPKDYISFTVVNILTGLCFGGKYEYGNEEVLYILKKEDDMLESFGVGAPEDFVPGLKYVYKTQMFKVFEEFTEEVMEGFMRRKFKQEESTFDRNNIRHFTDTLLLARLEAIEEEGQEAVDSLSEDHLVQTCADIFFAGIDTTRMTLGWLLNHMLAFPDIQEKVFEEIDRVVGKDRLPGMADRPNLSYTEAVIHESMRYSTVAPFGVMHMTACDTEVAGYKIPKGINVAINHWALHNDTEAWEDVNRFIPERFLDENGKLGPKPKNWLPFSAGTRVCLGEFVAKPELHLLFASLIQRYKWKMVSGKCADLTPSGTAFGLMAKPFKVMVERRK